MSMANLLRLHGRFSVVLCLLSLLALACNNASQSNGLAISTARSASTHTVTVAADAHKDDPPTPTELAVAASKPADGESDLPRTEPTRGTRLEVTIPEGADSTNAAVTFVEVDKTAEAFLGAEEIIGPAIAMEPANLAFTSPATVTIDCDPTQRPLVAAAKLVPARFQDEHWQKLDNPTWDPAACRATGETLVTGTFGLVQELKIETIDQVTSKRFSVGGVSVVSSECVEASIAVNANAIRMTLKAANKPQSATIDFEGLRPNGDVYVFDGSYDKGTYGKSDANGRFSYEQELSDTERLVWLQPVPATIYINADNALAVCAAIGQVTTNPAGCLLTEDIGTGCRFPRPLTPLA